MAFTLGTLFEAALLVINAIAILNEKYFLKKVGWSTDNRNEGFGDQSSIKSQLISLITAVQTLLRIPLIAVNILVILYELILG
ncbi:PREDICTED: immediate early response 3-interacting protein 1-like [Amphimedon queenslandica]|uniref:Immediate early response 3-interacting protein 1 n=1 Tax=Amphimedon queenslandica TaxID=400682 RepID=A0AAN0IBR0_AMPQE|nr:PREDICTED: immediate early response 3-interacting protein 1-like [Amphimedon queenslandica]|eukprot:XP_003384818.1 PREDICTED: immediate early response 3-interacting protein 1-like [Amphimedon queenslandica]